MQTALHGPAALCALLAPLMLHAVSSAQAQTADGSDPALGPRIEAYVEASMANQAVPGALYVRQDSVVLYEGYHGAADRAAGRGFDADTLFDIGSLTKQFTAAAVLALVEQGRLRLDAPLADFFPEAPADKRAITVHQLLSHTSGLSDETGGFDGRDSDPYMSAAAFLAPLWASPLNRPPGTGYEYTNAGYSVLAMIIERVTGLDYETALRALVLEPAGLTRTGYRQMDWTPDQVAHGYDTRLADPARADRGLFYLERWRTEPVSYQLRGNGGLYSTPADMVRWMTALMDGTVLSPGSVALLGAAHTPLDDPFPPDFTHYGYGWGVGQRPDGADWLSHSGSNGVFVATVQYGPETDVLIVHMTNAARGTVGRMGYEIARMMDDPNYAPAPVSGNAVSLVLDYTTRHEPDAVDGLPDYVAARLPRGLHAPWILNRAGFYRLERGETDWALALMGLNLALFPGDGNLHDSLAMALQRSGREAEAAAHYRRALALAPEDGDCHWCAHAQQALTALESAHTR